MDIETRYGKKRSTHTITGSYDELLSIASLFRLYDPAGRFFYNAANLDVTHESPSASVADITDRKLSKILSKLSTSYGNEHPITALIRDAQNKPELT